MLIADWPGHPSQPAVPMRLPVAALIALHNVATKGHPRSRTPTSGAPVIYPLGTMPVPNAAAPSNSGCIIEPVSSAMSTRKILRGAAS
jgi:hypothetical protein